MEKYKILEVVDTFYPTVDGAINVVKNYAEEINKLTICKLGAPKPKRKQKYVDKETFEVFRCKSGWGPEGYRNAMPGIDRKFKKRLKEEKFDLIHTHSPFGMGRFALKFAKKQGIPVVATLHTQYHQDFERTFHNFKPFVKMAIKIIVKVFNGADAVWTVSHASKKYLRDYGYKGEIDVIRNGTDYVYPANAEELINKVNDAHSLHGQKNVFVFVGRMAMYKNLGLLCDAIKKVKEAGKDFKMLFVGGGFDLDELKAYATKQGIDDVCIFTGQIKDRALLQGYYLRGDLLLFPSTFDMASIALAEAAAHKLPSLVIEKSCSAEGVIDNENGFLAKEDADDYAEKIIALCDNEQKLKATGETAYNTLYRTWQDTTKEVLNKYIEIIEKYKKSK